MTNPVLPDDGVLVHIGPHKTGTSALQRSLAEHRSELRSHGILYPGRAALHNKPAAAAIQRPQGRERALEDPRHWENLLSQVRAWDGRVVLSAEVFCEASPEAIARVVDDLGADRVRIAITLRPLERLLPSGWQQLVRSGSATSFPDWLDRVLSPDAEGGSSSMFWMRNNHPELIRRWGDVVGLEHVTVVVVDDSDRTGIFRDFEAVLRLPAGGLAPKTPGDVNRSLSLPEVELLRRLNARVRAGLSDADYLGLIKRGAVQTSAQGRAPGKDEAKLVLPGWAQSRARELAHSYVSEIRDLGVPVVGDLHLLAPTTPIDDSVVNESPLEVPMDVAVELLANLVQAAVDTRDSAQRQGSTRATVTEHAKSAAYEAEVRLTARLHGIRRRLRRAPERGRSLTVPASPPS